MAAGKKRLDAPDRPELRQGGRSRAARGKKKEWPAAWPTGKSCWADATTWRFPEMGVSPVIIHLAMGSSLVNQPAIGVPPLMETPT